MITEADEEMVACTGTGDAHATARLSAKGTGAGTLGQGVMALKLVVEEKTPLTRRHHAIRQTMLGSGVQPQTATPLSKKLKCVAP